MYGNAWAGKSDVAAGRRGGVNSLVFEMAQADAGPSKGIQEVNAAGLPGSVVGIFNIVALDHSGQTGAGGLEADA